MTNRRFNRTEQAIFIAYYKIHDYPTVKRIAKKANISRATFYRHHRTASSIPHDHEDFLFKTYLIQMKSCLKKTDNLQIIFLRLLVFLANNREVITSLLRDGHKEIIKRMIDHLRPIICCGWHLADNLDKAYDIYANEVLGVIEFWGKQDFAITNLGNVLNEILYLTKTASEHLVPLTGAPL